MSLLDFFRKIGNTNVEMTPATGAAPQAGASRESIFPWRRRRARQLAAMQAAYLELRDLMRTINAHLEDQSRAQARLAEVLTDLPAALDGLRKAGDHAQYQTDVLKQIEEHLSHEAGVLERFSSTTSSLEQMGKTSAEMLARLAERSRESEDLLYRVLDHSQRRVAMLTTVLAVLTLLVIGTAVYLGLFWKVPHRAQISPVVPPPTGIHHRISQIPAAPGLREIAPAANTPAPDQAVATSITQQASTQIEESEPRTTPSPSAPPRRRHRFLFLF